MRATHRSSGLRLIGQSGRLTYLHLHRVLNIVEEGLDAHAQKYGVFLSLFCRFRESLVIRQILYPASRASRTIFPAKVHVKLSIIPPPEPQCTGPIMSKRTFRTRLTRLSFPACPPNTTGDGLHHVCTMSRRMAEVRRLAVPTGPQAGRAAGGDASFSKTN